jgi:hypothetical protein
MNRKERRTYGKQIIERLDQINRSKVLEALNFDDIPKDILDSLIANTCENRPMQKRYNLYKRLLEEKIRLEIDLHNMKIDLAEKAKRQT